MEKNSYMYLFYWKNASMWKNDGCYSCKKNELNELSDN